MVRLQDQLLLRLLLRVPLPLPLPHVLTALLQLLQWRRHGIPYSAPPSQDRFCHQATPLFSTGRWLLLLAVVVAAAAAAAAAAVAAFLAPSCAAEESLSD